MSLSAELLEMLRCSESKQQLIYFPDGDGTGGAFFFCPASRLRYPIDEHGIPVMLIDEAVRVDDRESARIVSKAKELGLRIP